MLEPLGARSRTCTSSKAIICSGVSLHFQDLTASLCSHDDLLHLQQHVYFALTERETERERFFFWSNYKTAWLPEQWFRCLQGGGMGGQHQHHGMGGFEGMQGGGMGGQEGMQGGGMGGPGGMQVC